MKTFKLGDDIPDGEYLNKVTVYSRPRGDRFIKVSTNEDGTGHSTTLDAFLNMGKVLYKLEEDDV